MADLTYPAGMRLALAALILCVSASVARAEDAIAYGDGGLRVGATVVFTKPVTAAAYDAALDLVWINSKGTLQVLDLRTSPPKATVIAKKMPEGGFDIAGTSTATTGNVYALVFPVLKLGKSFKFSSAEGVYGELDMDEEAEQQARKRIKKIKLVGKKWLKALKKRTTRALRVAAAAPAAKVALPAGVCESEDPDVCGEVTPFGHTAYQLALTQYSCGDACFTGCVLYDPKTKKLASPLEPSSAWGQAAIAGGCSDYLFASDDKTYLYGAMRCTLDRAVTCTEDAGWVYVGWTA